MPYPVFYPDEAGLPPPTQRLAELRKPPSTTPRREAHRRLLSARGNNRVPASNTASMGKTYDDDDGNDEARPFGNKAEEVDDEPSSIRARPVTATSQHGAGAGSNGTARGLYRQTPPDGCEPDPASMAPKTRTTAHDVPGPGAASGGAQGNPDADGVPMARQSVASVAGSNTSTRMLDFFGPGIFAAVLRNPTTAHQLAKFSNSRLCGENVGFLSQVGPWLSG